MATTVVNAQAPFRTDCKRLYMPGVAVVTTCPECKRPHRHDFKDSYLNDPFANKPFDLRLYCHECEHEWTVPCVLRIVLDALPVPPPPPIVVAPPEAASCDRPEDFIDQLADSLEKAGARVTFDSARDSTKPCFNCGTTTEPRRLVRVGMWERKVGNRGNAADPIQRPLCASCEG